MVRSKNNGMSKSALKRDQPNGNGSSDVYNEMLRNALSSSPPPGTVEGRPVKRRKTAGGVQAVPQDSAHGLPAPTSIAEDDLLPDDSTRNAASGGQQIAYNESDCSEDSDFDWEDVDLAQTTTQEQVSVSKNDGKLDLVLGGNADSLSPGRLSRRRKPATAEERKMRREIHKLHVLCLLAHVHLRNHWCNDEAVHKSLRGLLSKKNVSYLNPDESQSQFQRTRSFLDGLNQAVEAFKLHFKVTARGMSRSYWAENADELAGVNSLNGLDLPIEKPDFQDLAEQRKASRDVGAQIFCALLRSVGVDARLVCSLQPLPFSGGAKGKPPPPTKPPIYTAATLKEEVMDSDSESGRGKAAAKPNPSSAIGSLGGRNRFASAPSRPLEQQVPSNVSTGTCSRGSENTPMRPKRIVESSYPIYWVEAFDEAAQKWISVDPLVTKTIGKPFKLEPPIGDQRNNMSYVIAFEDDGSARDVTRRYVKAYNAKTRKARLEAIPQGTKWLKRVLRLYKRPHRLDRDQVEDTELTGKEAQEPLPDNVQDFKAHPYYALERHLKRNEVIYPKRETGKVMNGRAANAKGSEPIYRRRDVHVVRSADSWYRMGREIKPGEQPLKRVAARRKQQQAASYEESDVGDDETTDTALYAADQTIEYQPPSVVNGRVPRNVYGNLDVYVPSMIPAGGAHVVHPECARAARLLGVDFAEAVTGFAFKGRHGTAIVDGAVVAAEFVTAIQEVISEFANERAQEEEARRSGEALRMWRRLLAGLRIRERIEGYNVEGDADVPHAAQADLEDDTIDGEAGGFFPTGDAEAITASAAVGSAPYQNDNTVGEKFAANSNAAGQHTDLIDGIASPPGYQPKNHYLESHEQDLVEAVQIPWVMPIVKVVYGSKNLPSHKKDVKNNQEGGGGGGGGGFMMDVDDLEVTRRSLSTITKEQSPPISLPDEDLAQARIVQESYESQGRALESQPTTQSLNLPRLESPKRLKLECNTSKEPTPTPSDTGEDQAPSEEISLPNKDRTPLQEEVSEDDAGSLLSEDPDDEDADPEWLV